MGICTFDLRSMRIYYTDKMQLASNLHYWFHALLAFTLPTTIVSSRCEEISNTLQIQAPLVAKCRELSTEVQCVTALSAPLSFANGSFYCRCLDAGGKGGGGGGDLHLLNSLTPSLREFISALYPNQEFWLNVKLRVIDKFTDVKGNIYGRQELIVQNNPHIDHCAAVWPGREAVTGDLVRQAHPCLHSMKYFVCRKDGAACNDITDENRGRCIIIRVSSRVSWYVARKECIQDGGDLLYLQGTETYSSVLGDRKMAEQVWVGLRRAMWQWEQGTEVLDADWSPDQLPAASNATCVTLSTSSGEWHTRKCNDSFSLLCAEFKQFTSGTKKGGTHSINYYIIGGILGGIVIILILVLCCVWMCRCRDLEGKPANGLRYMTMPAEDVFRNQDITAAVGNVIPSNNNLLRNVSNAGQLQTSANVHRDRLGNVRPHSGGFPGNRPQLGRSLSSTTRPPQFIAQTMRSVSLEDISQTRSSWNDPPIHPPPMITAVSGSQGNIPQSSPLFIRQVSQQSRNSKNRSKRNGSPNNKDRHLRNSKNKINRMNSKNVNNNDNKSRKSRNAPLTPAFPSQRTEIILGVQDGQLIDQNNKPKSKHKKKRKKPSDPRYVNEVPPVPPRGYRTDSQQLPLSEDQVIEDHPSDYNSHDRFRY